MKMSGNLCRMGLNRVGCFDVGIRCGGWGHIALEVKIEDRE